MRHSRVSFLKGLGVGCLCLALTVSLRAASVTVDGAQTYQTIDGFGVNANHRSWTNEDLEPVLDALIDQGGMTIFRIIFDNSDWEGTNDNSDPDVMNWTYYNQIYNSQEFQELWGITAYLNQKGITNGIMFNFQGWGPSWMIDTSTGTLLSGYEDEWAETVASLLIYARTNQGLQFNLVGPDNEEDNPGTVQGIVAQDSSQYVTMLHYLAEKLNNNGLGDVRFDAPDMAFTDTSWWSAMMNDSLVMSKVAHFGLHTYVTDGDDYDDGGFSDGIESFLQGSAYPNVDFWATEFNVWCDSCAAGYPNTEGWEYYSGVAQYLLAQLANGASAALIWDGYDGYYMGDPYPGPAFPYYSTWGLLELENPGGSPAIYTPRKSFYTMSQISKFVRPGAQRIDVSGALDSMVLLGFYQSTNAQLALTGVNTNDSPVVLTVTLENLPAFSSIELFYTDPSTNLCDAGAVPVSSGVFQVTIPPSCVFTLANTNIGTPLASVGITSPTNNAVFNAPADVPIQASASSSIGSISSVTFFDNSGEIGEVDGSPYDIVWYDVGPGIYTLTASATNSVGDSAVSGAVTVYVAGPAAQIALTPASAIARAGTTMQFAATATDQFGTALNPQPAYSWTVTGGGTIDANGDLTAESTTGGPFIVTATSGSLSATASFTIVPDDLVAAYGFEEGGGTNVTDSSGNGNTGFISGNAIWTTGKFGGALSFDGSSAVITVPDSTSLDLTRGMTLEAWVYPLSVGQINPVIFKSGSGFDCYLFDASSGSTTPELYCNGFSEPVFAPSALAANTWTYLAATYNETNAIIYVNGAAVANVPRSTPISISPGSLTIGFASPSYFLGTIDEVRIYNQALSAVQIQIDMNTPVVASLIPAAVLNVSAGPGGVVITWPGTLANYQLESTTSLAQPVTWSAVTNTPSAVNGQWQVVIPSAGQQQFFRLHQL